MKTFYRIISQPDINNVKNMTEDLKLLVLILEAFVDKSGNVSTAITTKYNTENKSNLIQISSCFFLIC